MENKIDEFKVKVLKDCFEVTFLSFSSVFDENNHEEWTEIMASWKTHQSEVKIVNPILPIHHQKDYSVIN